jgi:hypothetical protein
MKFPEYMKMLTESIREQKDFDDDEKKELKSLGFVIKNDNLAYLDFISSKTVKKILVIRTTDENGQFIVTIYNNKIDDTKIYLEEDNIIGLEYGVIKNVISEIRKLIKGEEDFYDVWNKL